MPRCSSSGIPRPAPKCAANHYCSSLLAYIIFQKPSYQQWIAPLNRVQLWTKEFEEHMTCVSFDPFSKSNILLSSESNTMYLSSIDDYG